MSGAPAEREGSVGLERVIFFSDAVFAIRVRVTKGFVRPRNARVGLRPAG